MRDVLVTLIVFGAVPWILVRPHIGILVWSWLAYMNPQRMGWGFAYSWPFSAITAIALFAGFILSNEKKRFPVTALTVVWIMFFLWMFVTTYFSLNPDLSMIQFKRAVKIQVVAMLTVVLMARRERIEQLIWVIVLSIGFFGIKGGIFTILTGGSFRVWGPPESFIEGNNELALALIIVIPLMRYLQLHSGNKWVRRGLAASMILCGLSIIASYSRGAFLAGSIMLFFMWAKSRYRLVMMIVLAILAAVVTPMLPDQWISRMNSIETYEDDGSAMGRINTWHFAFNLANDYPVTGGGFDTFTPELFTIYAPNPLDVHDAHSIYFEVLAEQGYVGLMLFLLIWILSLGTCRKIIRDSRGDSNKLWAMDLASMLQVSMVGYLTGGTFLGLAYFDLPYHIVGLAVLAAVVIRQEPENAAADAVPPDRRDHDQETGSYYNSSNRLQG